MSKYSINQALELLILVKESFQPGETFWTDDLGRLSGQSDNEIILKLNMVKNKENIGIILWKIRPVKGRHSWYFSKIGP